MFPVNLIKEPYELKATVFPQHNPIETTLGHRPIGNIVSHISLHSWCPGKFSLVPDRQSKNYNLPEEHP